MGRGWQASQCPGHLTVTAVRVVFRGGVRCPPRPHYLCTDLYRLSLALIFLIQYCDLSNAVSSLGNCKKGCKTWGKWVGRVCTVLCVVLLCVVCFDFFVCFYLFYINISFLLKKKPTQNKKQIQLWLVKKESSPDSVCKSQECAPLGSGGAGTNHCPS